MNQNKKTQDQIQRDSGLIHRYQQGDKQAFTQLFNSYKSKLYAYAYTRTRSKTDADDITQEVFIKFYNTLSKGKLNAQNVCAWLLSTAHHHIIDLFRKQKSPIILMDTIPDAFTHDISNSPISDQHIDILLDAINKLPQKDRTIIQLHYVQKKRWKHIAQVLNIREKSASGRLPKILKKLKKKLKSLPSL